jgi:hypothetical protein
MGAMAGWVWTDDPGDPCSLCIQWRNPDGRFTIDPDDDAVPCTPSGEVVARVYRGVHRRHVDS